MQLLAPRFALLFILLGSFTQCFSQVGINTTEPTATLDVNGNIRVREMKSNFTEYEAVKIVGLDSIGNFVEVEIDENVILEDNKLRVVESKYRFAETQTISTTIVNNLSLIILPGEPNDDKKIMKIVTTGGDVEITGIVAGEDGQTIWLFAYSGKVKLSGNSPLSDAANQILISGNGANPSKTLQRYDMIQLVYDAGLQKWIIMDY